MQSCALQRRTKANSAKWSRMALKTALVGTKKNRCSSMRKLVPLFACEHLKKKTKIPQKRCHWVTPLFKSGISLDTLSKGVTRWQHFRGTLRFFLEMRNVPWKCHLYFWIIIVLPNDDVSTELCAFFRNIFLQNISKKKHKVLQKRHLYFWIMVLPNDDVFGELALFFQKYFFTKYFEKKVQCSARTSSFFLWH